MNRQNVLLLILAGTVALAIWRKDDIKETGNLIMSKLSRGYRNNNPGNLRDFNIPWQGLIGNESGYGSFAKFDTMINGARAAAKDVRGDIERDGSNTIRKVIAEYAPVADDNNTAAYIAAVSKAVGIGPDSLLVWSRDKFPLMLAIFKHENGYIHAESDLRKGIELA